MKHTSALHRKAKSDSVSLGHTKAMARLSAVVNASTQGPQIERTKLADEMVKLKTTMTKDRSVTVEMRMADKVHMLFVVLEKQWSISIGDKNLDFKRVFDGDFDEIFDSIRKIIKAIENYEKFTTDEREEYVGNMQTFLNLDYWKNTGLKEGRAHLKDAQSVVMKGIRRCGNRDELPEQMVSSKIKLFGKDDTGADLIDRTRTTFGIPENQNFTLWKIVWKETSDTEEWGEHNATLALKDLVVKELKNKEAIEWIEILCEQFEGLMASQKKAREAEGVQYNHSGLFGNPPIIPHQTLEEQNILDGDEFEVLMSEPLTDKNIKDAVRSFCGVDIFKQEQVERFGFLQDDLPEVQRGLSDKRMTKRETIGRFGFLPDWDVSKATDMRGLFKDIGCFNMDLSRWNVSKVTDMSHMFENAASFNQPLTNWDVSSVTTMSEMFKNAKEFRQRDTVWHLWESIQNMEYEKGIGIYEWLEGTPMGPSYDSKLPCHDSQYENLPYT